MRPIDFHQTLPDYTPTPLRDMPELAKQLGVGRVLLKDESSRLGLPAFKILGASWAVANHIARVSGRLIDSCRTFDTLGQLAQSLGPITLITATDGNHGRGVARVARWFGFNAEVWMPAGSAQARVDAIESEHAIVTVVDGDYDQAVEAADATVDEHHRWLIQDTSWAGYHEIPGWIIDGYATLFDEIAPQRVLMNADAIHAVFVPVGVGSLAVAAVRSCAQQSPRPTLFGVEPTGADCLARSCAAGELVHVPGPHRSIMAGLNCGSIALDAWPLLRDGVDHALVIEDETARQAIRLLADHGIAAGETGAASLAGLLHVRQTLNDSTIGEDATVLLLLTEGVTDPVGYHRAMMTVAAG